MKNTRVGRWLRGPAFVAVVVLGLADGRASADEFTFNWTDGHGVEHAGRGVIELPSGWAERGLDERVGVVLFGGGLSHDADWTVPGSIDHLGEPMQLTRDGEDTRDGRTLAHALRDAGLGVARFELGVRKEGDGSPPAAVGFADSLACARAGWEAALRGLGLPEERVIVLGHSLGATRGVLVSEGRARGYVLLAGAYMSYEAGWPAKLAEAAMGRLETSASECSREHLERASDDVGPAAREARRLALESFDEIDVDGAGTLSGWELAAWTSPRERPRELFRPDDGTPWAIDVLIGGGRPVLALWGGRDPISMHGPVLAEVARRAGAPVECRSFPELGHQLDAPDGASPGRFPGPIDAGVVRVVVEWCAGRAAADE